MFIQSQLMIAHFEAFPEYAKYRPELCPLVGRYFPLFWDGSVTWLAVDLDASHQSRVVAISLEGDYGPRLVRETFAAFLEEATLANEEDRSMGCLEGS